MKRTKFVNHNMKYMNFIWFVPCTFQNRPSWALQIFVAQTDEAIVVAVVQSHLVAARFWGETSGEHVKNGKGSTDGPMVKSGWLRMIVEVAWLMD